jgi:ribosomal protein S12 methylthiotransferase
MVGFPGETEAAFRELVAFVETVRFDHLGVFAFSPEPGTRAARLEPRVSAAVARKRQEAIMARQRELSLEINRRRVGRILPVLIEGFSDETDLLLTGRGAFMAPEVDGQVLINKGEGVAGEIMPVRISEAHPYDLVGEIMA